MTRRDYQPALFHTGLLPTWLRHLGFDEIEPVVAGQASAKSNYALSEDESHVYLEVSMPGIEASDIEVSYEKGTVRIQAQAKKEESDPARKYYRRMDSSYSFSFALPGDVDESREPKASYANGVLSMSFDKLSTSSPKKIQVQKK